MSASVTPVVRIARGFAAEDDQRARLPRPLEQRATLVAPWRRPAPRSSPAAGAERPPGRHCALLLAGRRREERAD
eukprot:6866667-Prymnesium_polylepis.1